MTRKQRNKKFHKSLHQQVYDKLIKMQAFGESRHDAKRNKTSRGRIFSIRSFKNIKFIMHLFLDYINKFHKDVKTMKKLKKYVPEWIYYLENNVSINGKPFSAYTINTYASAVYKVLDIKPGDKYYVKPPARLRCNITRSRSEETSKKYFSAEKNIELVNFCKGTGLRREELSNLRGKDLLTKAQIEKHIKRLESNSSLSKRDRVRLSILKETRLYEENYYVYTKGKGGRERLIPIIGENTDQIVEKMRNTPKEEKVWPIIPSHAPIHSYRSDYANEIYLKYSRNIDDIAYEKKPKGIKVKQKSEIYFCRKEYKGLKLDKKALLVGSKCLGHNRLNVIPEYYIRPEKLKIKSD